ncbi:MAG: VCBS repeat-containing protein [Chloroflexi bacterium]|nr:VCBS repeat-containing protein [Chloroflexota bacterium]
MKRLFPFLFLLLLGPSFHLNATPTGGIPAPVLKWQKGGCFSSWCETGWYASPAVADIDNDGQQEILWGSLRFGGSEWEQRQ